MHTVLIYSYNIIIIMKIALVLAALALFVLATETVNIKKKYCGNDEYVGNPGSKYPPVA